MKNVILSLTISPGELQRWYQGQAQQIVATAVDGKRVKFPVNILQEFVTHNGIKGTFKIVFDDEGRFLEVSEVC